MQGRGRSDEIKGRDLAGVVLTHPHRPLLLVENDSRWSIAGKMCNGALLVLVSTHSAASPEPGGLAAHRMERFSPRTLPCHAQAGWTCSKFEVSRKEGYSKNDLSSLLIRKRLL